jgi:plastocyanin
VKLIDRTFRCTAALAACLAALAAGCAGGSPYGPISAAGIVASPSPSPSPSSQPTCVTPLPPAGTEIIGVDLNITSCTDDTYQEVIGYFGGGTITTAEVISIIHSPTDIIQFHNLDIQPHTAADMGTWTGTYPQNGPDPASTPSPTGTDISATGFTAGNLNPGKLSKKYVADVPGVYLFGCAYHYAPTPGGMRTIIIVQ